MRTTLLSFSFDRAGLIFLERPRADLGRAGRFRTHHALKHMLFNIAAERRTATWT